MEHLAELGRLADTAGAVIVASMTQQLERPDSATYLGKGKVEELATLGVERDATVVIFDDELTPAQGKNLEEQLGKRVVDRAELILDIFAHARGAAEAKMQVELGAARVLAAATDADVDPPREVPRRHRRARSRRNAARDATGGWSASASRS